MALRLGHPSRTPTPDDGVARITLGDDYFSPAVLIIKTGTVVEWWHGGSKEHTIVSAQNHWAPIFPGYGSRHRLSFNKPGEYAYTCSLHSGMDAKIVVVD